MMHSLYAISDIGYGTELLKLYVEELNDVNSDGTIIRSYQLQNIENQHPSGRVQENNSLAPISLNADTYTVSDLFNIVKQYDKNFKPKETSFILNDDGTPKVVYHRSNAEETNIHERGFDIKNEKYRIDRNNETNGNTYRNEYSERGSSNNLVNEQSPKRARNVDKVVKEKQNSNNIRNKTTSEGNSKNSRKSLKNVPTKETKFSIKNEKLEKEMEKLGKNVPKKDLKGETIEDRWVTERFNQSIV